MTGEADFSTGATVTAALAALNMLRLKAALRMIFIIMRIPLF